VETRSFFSEEPSIIIGKRPDDAGTGIIQEYHCSR
jgi:hypothetical protein